MGCMNGKQDDEKNGKEEKGMKRANTGSAQRGEEARSELAVLSVKTDTKYADEFIQAVGQEVFLRLFSTSLDHDKAKQKDGFMILVEEQDGLSDKQKQDLKRAQEIGLKVFRTYTDDDFLSMKAIRTISATVRSWCDDKDKSGKMDMENIFVGKDGAKKDGEAKP
eukprot:CAMPEP_0172757274 /NCGR_PEP_ID=MMETSP1074-20121228/163449_1 /TAXON_ID=2916 /ORGANISM="Ceratium fusus, Strain PA161109" /LENGTH=164 /DNA_ID=CAMNT_0013590673 /DNA_START=19 /DNA_END=513 /DNA_ORIENTATION=+